MRRFFFGLIKRTTKFSSRPGDDLWFLSIKLVARLPDSHFIIPWWWFMVFVDQTGCPVALGREARRGSIKVLNVREARGGSIKVLNVREARGGSMRYLERHWKVVVRNSETVHYSPWCTIIHLFTIFRHYSPWFAIVHLFTIIHHYSPLFTNAPSFSSIHPSIHYLSPFIVCRLTPFISHQSACIVVHHASSILAHRSPSFITRT